MPIPNNKKALYSSQSIIWVTPQPFFDKLNEEFGFNTDVCALPDNAKCNHFYTPEIDGLKQPWKGTVWMNPPYGEEMPAWLKKAYEESQKGTTVVALIPARTDTKAFHEYVLGKAELRFVKGRIKFSGKKLPLPFLP